MHIPTVIRRALLPLSALVVATACASGSSAGWTYAPLGPSANPSAAATAGASQPVGSGGSGGPGVPLDVETTASAPLAFSPTELSVPAGSTVTVTYTNNSNLPHNINFFDGPTNSAPSLGATAVGSGPNDVQTVTFTAPSTPGDYLFWCDVHQSAMEGTLHVQ